MKNIKYQIRVQVLNQILKPVGIQVQNQVWDQVWVRARNQIWDQVSEQVWAHNQEQLDKLKD